MWMPIFKQWSPYLLDAPFHQNIRYIHILKKKMKMKAIFAVNRESMHFAMFLSKSYKSLIGSVARKKKKNKT